MSLLTARLSAMMFLQFFIWGAWYVTVGNYMSAYGMADWIGMAYTVGPIAAIISPFFLGMIADRFFATERVLGVMHILGGVAILCAPFAAVVSPLVFTLTIFVHMLCYMPTLGLTNTLAFHNIENQEKEFPIIRVFGTIGWIAANWVVSSGFKADFSPVQFYVTSAACIVLGVFSFTLPHTPPPAAGKKASVREILGLDALQLMKSRSFAVFLISSFLICIPLAAYYAFAPVFAGSVLVGNANVAAIKESTGGWINLADIATTMSFGQISEIVFMLLMPLLFMRMGAKWMLAVGMLAWVVRYGLFAGADTNDVMWMVILGILLHGICYDFFFVTGFIYTDKRCTKAIRGQAQGLLVLVTQGLGLGIGAQVMGRIVGYYTPPKAAELQGQAAALSKQAFATTDVAAAAKLQEQAQALGLEASRLMDWQSIWLIPCIAAAVVMVIFIALFKDDSVDSGIAAKNAAKAATEDQQP